MGMTLEECIEKIAELTEDRSRLVKNRHKHADVIIAWANGEDVEWYDPLNARWYPIIATDKALVCWGMTDYEYRVKPKIVKKEGWVARYRDGSTGGSIYPTKDKSQKVYEHAVDHHRIEWEEEE